MASQLHPISDLRRRCFLLVPFLLSLLLFSGCQTIPEAEPTAGVQGPDSTPFDANPIARMAYLDSYQAGYRSAVRGGPTSTDFIRGPHQFARELGWRAGASAAQLELEERRVDPPQQ